MNALKAEQGFLLVSTFSSQEYHYGHEAFHQKNLNVKICLR